MADDKTIVHRFAQDVSTTAPKPGFQLATIAFQRGTESHIMSVIEGPANDMIGIVGLRTDFERTRQVRLSLQGSLFEVANDLNPQTYDRPLVLNFYGPRRPEASGIGVDSAVTVFSSQKAYQRADPESAAVRYALSGGQQHVNASITGYQRGWAYAQVIVAGACLLWGLDRLFEDGQMLLLTVERDAGQGPGQFSEATGGVTFRNTVIGPAGS
jgi:hypothetical protein